MDVAECLLLTDVLGCGGEKFYRKLIAENTQKNISPFLIAEVTQKNISRFLIAENLQKLFK